MQRNQKLILPICMYNSIVEMYSDYCYIKDFVLGSVPNHMRVEVLVFDEKTDKELY